jgi:hypothetical protein
MRTETTRLAFAGAFIKQARSDWEVYQPLCHRLHYLQMACEKLAKAYRLRDTHVRVDGVIRSHAGFEKFVGAFSVTIKDDFRDKDAQLRVLVSQWRSIAREIEKLAPAADRESTPENAEYPWEQDGRVVVPCEYAFPSLELLLVAGGRNFLKVVQRALDDFEKLTIA